MAEPRPPERGRRAGLPGAVDGGRGHHGRGGRGPERGVGVRGRGVEGRGGVWGRGELGVRARFWGVSGWWMDDGWMEGGGAFKEDDDYKGRLKDYIRKLDQLS